MARVVLKGLGKAYGTDGALVDLDLEIADGEFVSVLGPSGSGKSTMLKLIAGIEEASHGRIYFDEVDVTHVPPERRDIAMVFQSYALYPTMSVFDNIAFPLRVRKLAKGEVRSRVEQAAELLGVSHLLGRRPRQLSGGERQRVAIGRAIVREPAVFLLDEPISNLDAHLRAGMRQELKHIHRVLGTTFIYVTHDQDDALEMGDRIAVLARGRLQQYAASVEIYERPANRFVASFVGHPPMNLIDGTLAHRNGGYHFDSGDLSLPLGELALVREQSQVVLGIRAEDINVAAGSGGPSGVVEGLVAPGYQRLYATVRVADRPLTVRVPYGAQPPEIGETVTLDIGVRGAHVFDAVDGVRISERPPRQAPAVAAPAAR